MAQYWFEASCIYGAGYDGLGPDGPSHPAAGYRMTDNLDVTDILLRDGRLRHVFGRVIRHFCLFHVRRRGIAINAVSLWGLL